MTSTMTSERKRRPVYQEIALILQHLESIDVKREHCQPSEYWHWQDIRSQLLDALDAVMESAPSGSGIDNGTALIPWADMSKAMRKSETIGFTFSFHHMDEHGFYDGWTDHKLYITPSFTSAFDMRITGPDRNYIKEYLYELYQHWLTTEVDAYQINIPKPVETGGVSNG